MFRVDKALKGNASFPPLGAIIVMTSFGGEGLQAKKDTLPKAYFTQQKKAQRWGLVAPSRRVGGT